MKVRANQNFKWYRNISLKLEKKDFRALQAGKVVDIKKEDYEKYAHVYDVIEVKHGDK